jgi:hypothetical protein
VDKTNGRYCRSYRDGETVTREYFSDGEAAELAAGLDKRRQEEIATVKALRQRWDDAGKPMKILDEGTRMVLRAARLIARNPRVPYGDPRDRHHVPLHFLSGLHLKTEQPPSSRWSAASWIVMGLERSRT